MYENQTFEIIIERMLERAKSLYEQNGTPIDTSEGSIIYNILAPEAWELSEAYVAIDNVLDCTFADTAPREELILRARERGIEIKKATKAILKGEFNIDIELDSRFTLEDLSYRAIEKIGDCVFKMECETAGTIGNKKFGEIIPIEYIEGLENSKLSELLIPGTDEEDTESFRSRYFESFEIQSFGGNRADYIAKIKSISGVGGVKLVRATDKDKKIYATIITSEYNTPSATLVNDVQTIIDPSQNNGNGYGCAPIGHVVVINACSNAIINISADIALDTGYTWEEVNELVNNKISDYLLSLRKEWESSTNLVVRIAQISSKIVSVQGIEDINNIKINDVASNYMCNVNEIPVMGSVIKNVS